MTSIKGPEHPDKFRISDQWKRRWYVDPLPADDNWDAWDGQVPAISTLKKAWSKEFKKRLETGQTVKLDAYRAAQFAVDHIDHIRTVAKTDKPAAIASISVAADHALNRAARRGTEVHQYAEWRANNMPGNAHLFSDDARPYLPVIDQFVKETGPVFLYQEIVGIRRDWWGCTVDTILSIDGVTYAADWKTRGADSNHGCYPEEACQLGANTKVDYYLVRAPNGAVRIPPPQIDRGLIISLRPDGYELYPVELEPAAAAAEQLHASWTSKSEGQKTARQAIGRPIHPTAIAPSRAIDETLDCQVVADWLKRRITLLISEYPAAAQQLVAEWPQNLPTLKQGGHNLEQLDRIAVMCDRVEAAHQIPFGATRPLTAA